MSELNNQPSYQRGKKKYESNKTLAQIWMGRGIMIGIVLIVAIILYNFGFTVYLLFAKPDVDGPLIWSTVDGIGYSAKGGEPSGYFRLPTTSSEPIKNPRFNVIAGRLFYISPDTQSVCVVQPGQPERWVSLEAALGTECTVRDIRPLGKDAVMFLGYPKASDPDSLPMPVAAARLGLEAQDATPLGPQDVIVGADGNTFERTATGFAGVTDSPTKVVAWDYDFAKKRLYAVDGKTVFSIAGADRNEFGLGPLYFIKNVYAVNGEVWLAAVKPFKAGHLLLSYGPDGSFKKLKLKDKTDIRPPFIRPTPEMVELLHKISGGIQE